MIKALDSHLAVGFDETEVDATDSVGIMEPAAHATPTNRLPAIRDRSTPTFDVRRNLRAMVGDGAAWSVMVGIGENYIAAFALAAGSGEVVAGLVTSVPLIAGAILQVVSPWAAGKLGSNRRWVLLCAILQGFSILPLAICALLGGISPTLLFATTCLYWSASLAGGPAWNTWVGAIVPGRIRARYFSRRTRIVQAGTLLGFLAGGFLLQWGEARHQALLVFAFIFAVASICRFISVGYLASQSEPAPPVATAHRRTLPQWLRHLHNSGQSRLLWYLIAMQGVAQIASPFYSPYMLGELKFSYLGYVAVVATALLAKSLTSPLLGMVAHRWGARRLLTIGGWAVIPLPLLWLFCARLEYLMVVQLIAGVSWAAYELAVSLIYFEAIDPRERTAVLTTLNVGHSLATVIGSLIGGAIIYAMHDSAASYMVVFAISAAARVATLPLLSRWQKLQPKLRIVLADDSAIVRREAPRMNRAA